MKISEQLKGYYIEELIALQNKASLQGVTKATPEEIQIEINRRIELARNSNTPNLLYKYRQLGLI